MREGRATPRHRKEQQGGPDSGRVGSDIDHFDDYPADARIGRRRPLPVAPLDAEELAVVNNLLFKKRKLAFSYVFHGLVSF